MSATENNAAFMPVLTAMNTMRSGIKEQKVAAHQYLENFQKSVSRQYDNYDVFSC